MSRIALLRMLTVTIQDNGLSLPSKNSTFGTVTAIPDNLLYLVSYRQKIVS